MEETEKLQDLKSQIKAEASRLGFSACGVASVAPVEKETQFHFNQWLDKGYQSGMDYMARYKEIRMNPSLLMEDTRSILSLALNYYPPKQIPPEEPQIAWYAYGQDYHDVLKSKLHQLFEFIRTWFSSNQTNLSLKLPSSLSGRICVDTAPLLERYWAWKAGIGWIGKHTQLILPQKGSCFFLGEILLNLNLPSDEPMKEHCGKCKLCLEACPGKALIHPYTLDAEKCLSYQTIENRGLLSSEACRILPNKIYGCDECLKACPYHRFSSPTLVREFHPSSSLLAMTREKWNTFSVEEYRILFKRSAIKRVKYEGLMRNIQAADSAFFSEENKSCKK